MEENIISNNLPLHHCLSLEEVLQLWLRDKDKEEEYPLSITKETWSPFSMIFSFPVLNNIVYNKG